MTEAVLDGVRDLLPAFRERADETERLRQVPDASVKELEETGFFRMLQPQRFDGLEGDPIDFFTAVSLIGSACGFDRLDLVGARRPPVAGRPVPRRRAAGGVGRRHVHPPGQLVLRPHRQGDDRRRWLHARGPVELLLRLGARHMGAARRPRLQRGGPGRRLQARPTGASSCGPRRSPPRRAPTTSSTAGATPSAASTSATPTARAACTPPAPAPSTSRFTSPNPPTAGNPLLGLDLLSDPNIAGAITRARRSGQPEVLLPPRSPLTPGTGSRLLIVVPVAGGPHRPGAGSDLQGVLLTALPLPALAADRPPLLDPTLAIRLTPWTTPPRSAPPAWTPPRAEPPASWSWAPPPTRVPFFVRGQPWALELARPRR